MDDDDDFGDLYSDIGVGPSRKPVTEEDEEEEFQEDDLYGDLEPRFTEPESKHPEVKAEPKTAQVLTEAPKTTSSGAMASSGLRPVLVSGQAIESTLNGKRSSSVEDHVGDQSGAILVKVDAQAASVENEAEDEDDEALMAQLYGDSSFDPPEEAAVMVKQEEAQVSGGPGAASRLGRNTDLSSSKSAGGSTSPVSLFGKTTLPVSSPLQGPPVVVKLELQQFTKGNVASSVTFDGEDIKPELFSQEEASNAIPAQVQQESLHAAGIFLDELHPSPAPVSFLRADVPIDGHPVVSGVSGGGPSSEGRSVDLKPEIAGSPTSEVEAHQDDLVTEIEPMEEHDVAKVVDQQDPAVYQEEEDDDDDDDDDDLVILANDPVPGGEWGTEEEMYGEVEPYGIYGEGEFAATAAADDDSGVLAGGATGAAAGGTGVPGEIQPDGQASAGGRGDGASPYGKVCSPQYIPSLWSNKLLRVLVSS